MVLGVYVHKQGTERLKKNMESYRDCMIQVYSSWREFGAE